MAVEDPIPFSQLQQMRSTIKVVLNKLKTSSAEGPDGPTAELTSSESMLTYRLLTEHLGIKHEVD